jgi:hypothetical protein
MTAMITGAELRRYMTEKDLTLEDMGKLLGGKVATTIMRWQNGADIPGDTQILLKLLIRGEMPFKEESTPRQVRDAMWQLEMSLETWEEINRRRIAGGFATVTDWIASLVREELHEQQSRSDFRTSDHGAVDEMALVADVTTEDAAGAGDDVGAHTDAAAQAFAKQNPLPPAGESGAPAGTTAGRKDVTYKRPQARSGTGVKKR